MSSDTSPQKAVSNFYENWTPCCHAKSIWDNCTFEVEYYQLLQVMGGVVVGAVLLTILCALLSLSLSSCSGCFHCGNPNKKDGKSRRLVRAASVKKVQRIQRNTRDLPASERPSVSSRRSTVLVDSTDSNVSSVRSQSSVGSRRSSRRLPKRVC